jgi:hypothetical protein
MAKMQTEAEWKEAASTAKCREIAMFALGVAAGLRWARENGNEADMVPSIPLAKAEPEGKP